MEWNLEWYYFGDLVTLVAAGADNCSPSAIINDVELVDALHSMCSDKPKLKNILQGGKQNGEPLFFDEIRNLPSIKSRTNSLWKKNLEMDLMICTMLMPDHRPQVLLGLDKIILPWPFTVDVKKRESKLKKCIDFNRDPLPNNLLKIDPWMQTVEELLYDEDGKVYLDEFIKSGNRSAIIEFAWEKRRRELIAPSYFDASPDTSIFPIETYIKQKGKEIKLHVGVKEVKGVPADRENPVALFEKWPCGAS